MLIPVSARNPPGLWERLASPRGPQGAPPAAWHVCFRGF